MSRLCIGTILNAQAAELTDDLQERGLIAPDVVYHTPSQIGGLESVAGAGLWSPRLQRITMTMVERAEAGGAAGGARTLTPTLTLPLTPPLPLPLLPLPLYP